MSNHDVFNDAKLEEIAIVGMAGRFPGARNVSELWRNLCAGVESIRSLSDEEMLADYVSPADLAQPGVVKAGGILDDIDCFDAEFFGISKREAEIMDPQHRFFLECAWEALESAGHLPSRYRGSIGVFAGAGANTYLLSNLITRADVIEQLGRFPILLASDKDYLSTRVSYKLNLTGPSFTIQTACSTSLVATHVACQSLLNGECDLALAGGVSISVPQHAPYFYQEGGILSPDGHCRAFDADARGTVPGNGAGIVVLKRLSDARVDRDHVIAVIKGSAINNDGSSKVGFTAPGLHGQTRVLREALAVAGVDPESIGYIECHGTGTPLGDPNELEALAAAYGGDGAERSCAIGSVKTNLGHLDAAAGVTGLIKAALAVEHGIVVPSLHFSRPNPHFDFERSPFHVSSKVTAWPQKNGPRRAAVSSFGIGGTNAHVILEQAPTPARSERHRAVQLIPVSARTPKALARSLERVADAIEGEASLVLADVAYTLQTGRAAFACRRFVVSSNREEAAAALRQAASEPGIAGRTPDARPEIAFMFPGQGSQYVQMGTDLYSDAPVFQKEIDVCADLLRAHLGGEDIRRLLWPTGAAETSRARNLLDQTQYTQPALFATEYALARLWMSWGIVPQVLTGHSVGEYVGACLAGIFTLDDALALIAARGRLIQSLPAGSMLAVLMSEDKLRAELRDGVTIAAVNGPEQCVVAGRTDAIAAFEAALVTQGITCRSLPTSHAFHSPLMDPILAAFRAELGRVTLRSPTIRCLSNVTGTWLTADEAVDPGYWVRHLRETVRFGDGLATLCDGAERAFVEVGPGRALSRLLQRASENGASPAIVASLRDAGDAQSDMTALMSALGRLWTAGVTVDWDQVHFPYQPHRAALPTYPFERRRHWIEPATRFGQLSFEQPAPTQPFHEADSSDGPANGTWPSPRETRLEDPVQVSLASIWRELTGVDDVQASSNFFELGGDSLLMISLGSRIERVFAVKPPMRELFEAPTLEHMAAVVARHATSGIIRRPPIVPASREGGLPLSYAQQRVWFLEQFEPGTALYNIPSAIRITGSLDVAALEGSFIDLVARHESLRTSFHAVNGRPVQMIAAHVPFAIQRVDLGHVTASDRIDEARACAETEARLPIDLANAPLVRVLLVRLSDEDHLLVVTMHHIVSDARSIEVMVAELAELYRGRTTGTPALLHPLIVQPLDVTVWQQRWLESGELDRQLEYWRQLRGTLPILELPMDRPRSSRATSAGNTFSWQLDADSVAGLRALGRREGVTLFMTLLALYKTMLFRLSGQRDLCVGSPISTRSDQAMEHMIGFFVNTLLLRTQLDGASNFRQLLALVRDVTLDAFAHQDVPFEKLVEVLEPNRDVSRTPLFQTMFSLGNATAPVDLPGLSFSLTEIDVPIAKFDLTFEVTEHGGGLDAAFEYSTELFDRSTIERFAKLFDLLAQNVVAQPDSALAALPNMSDEEKYQLEVWSTTGAPAPWRGGVLEAFRACVERDPRHIAVEQGELALSYAELDRRAARLAQHLRALDVSADVLVGIHLPRTPDLIVALLAVLRAGGAYVPLDPGYPAERLALMLADARPRVVVTSRALRDRLPASASTIVALDELNDFDVAASGAPAKLPGPRPEDLAYVIYTSGTTGQPKGVQIPQAALANYAQAASTIFELTPSDRVLQFSSISFDTSAEEIFCTLTSGATLVLRTDDMIDSIPTFLAACERARVSVVGIPTAYWHTLTSQIAENSVSLPGRVRLMIIGGEQALAPVVARWLRIVGDRIRLLNAYGPTETTISATIADLTEHARRYPDDVGPVPIGQPVPGLRVHVLDESGQRVPVGVTGELFVGGAGLARGYLGDESLTGKRFIPDIFATDGDARMYRTGDLVRYRADGLLEYVGRADQQVKVRGYRIELGDIEASIGRHPRVLENVVIAREDIPGDRRLVAYVVPKADSTLTLQELNTSLSSSLPEYMHPTALVLLSGLPVSPTGKVDRRALPAPLEGGPSDREMSEPRNDLESSLAELFGQVLGLKRVGITEDFFQLGGHSLLAAELLSRINTGLDLDVSLRQLFATPTVERLALAIEDMLLDQLENEDLESLRPPDHAYVLANNFVNAE
jgi:amino acid adenylation domain-containing protein